MQIHSPQNGIFVTGILDLDFTITDAFPCITEYNIDGNGWIPYHINPDWNSTTILDGEHILEIRSTDPVGHVAEQKIKLYVDNNGPSCALHSPAKGQYLEGIFTFKILAQDEVGVRSVKIDVFDETVKATYNSQTNYFEYSVALNTVLDGSYNISITAVDRSGKVTVIGPNTILVDNNAPILTINKPLSNDFVSKTIPIDITVSDSFKTESYYNIDGSGWITTDVPWVTSNGRDGEHEISIRVLDAAGHVTERAITVNVDNTAPKVTLISPKENDFISGVYTVEVYAYDISGIESVQLVIDDGMKFDILQNPSTGLFEVPIDTTKLELEDGEHTFEFQVRDKVFKLSTTSTIIIIDNTPPKVILDYPETGEEHIYFKINATDLSGIDRVLINIDGMGWQEINNYADDNFTHRYIWRTGRDDNGNHDFNIKVFDILGNEAKLSGELKVDNQEEEDYLGTFMDLLPLLFFIIFIILIIIIFVFFKRGTFQAWLSRSKDKDSDTEQDGDRGPDFGLDNDDASDDDYEFEFNRGGGGGGVDDSGLVGTGNKTQTQSQQNASKPPFRISRFRGRSTWKKDEKHEPPEPELSTQDMKTKIEKRRVKVRKVKK
jgi:hypothetical protein